jgi:hypothetical protein
MTFHKFGIQTAALLLATMTLFPLRASAGGPVRIGTWKTPQTIQPFFYDRCASWFEGMPRFEGLETFGFFVPNLERFQRPAEVAGGNSGHFQRRVLRFKEGFPSMTRFP